MLANVCLSCRNNKVPVVCEDNTIRKTVRTKTAETIKTQVYCQGENV